MDNEIKKVKNYEPQRQRMLELHRLKKEKEAKEEINRKQVETQTDQKKEVERSDVRFYDDNDKNNKDIVYDFECICDCGNELVELEPVDDLTKQAIEEEGFDLICDRCGNLYSDDEFFK